jgi:hypothetical protein
MPTRNSPPPRAEHQTSEASTQSYPAWLVDAPTQWIWFLGGGWWAIDVQPQRKSLNSTTTRSWFLLLVDSGIGEEKRTTLWARLMAELVGPEIKRDPNNPVPRWRILLRPELHTSEKTNPGPVGYGPPGGDWGRGVRKSRVASEGKSRVHAGVKKHGWDPFLPHAEIDGFSWSSPPSGAGSFNRSCCNPPEQIMARSAMVGAWSERVLRLTPTDACAWMSRGALRLLEMVLTEWRHMQGDKSARGSVERGPPNGLSSPLERRRAWSWGVGPHASVCRTRTEVSWASERKEKQRKVGHAGVRLAWRGFWAERMVAQ